MAVVEIGQRFGFLVALRKSPPRHWIVRCDCGIEKRVQQAQLHGAPRPIKSCGCKRIELLRASRLEHGCSVKGDTPEYRTFVAWQSMLWRCNNKARRDYKDYGGRGIKVCDRWRDFANFRADLGLKPDGSSLGRINNNGNYEPGNVRWESAGEQSNNKRSNHVIEHDGRKQTISQWAREVGIEKSKLRGRIVAGWTIERALKP